MGGQRRGGEEGAINWLQGEGGVEDEGSGWLEGGGGAPVLQQGVYSTKINYERSAANVATVNHNKEKQNSMRRGYLKKKWMNTKWQCRPRYSYVEINITFKTKAIIIIINMEMR